MTSNFFAKPDVTIEAAQSHYSYKLFAPAAVFELPEGKGYVMAYIREQNYPPHETAKNMQELGYKMVACCDPVLGAWSPYEYPKEQEHENNQLVS